MPRQPLLGQPAKQAPVPVKPPDSSDQGQAATRLGLSKLSLHGYTRDPEKLVEKFFGTDAVKRDSMTNGLVYTGKPQK